MDPCRISSIRRLTFLALASVTLPIDVEDCFAPEEEYFRMKIVVLQNENLLRQRIFARQVSLKGFLLFAEIHLLNVLSVGPAQPKTWKTSTD